MSFVRTILILLFFLGGLAACSGRTTLTFGDVDPGSSPEKVLTEHREAVDRMNRQAGTTNVRVRQMQPIIAFGSSSNLTQCLDRLTSPAQLLAANDGSIIAGGNCSFGKPVVSFRAFPADFHVTGRFIFPIFRIAVAGQSAERYSHDGIFSRRDWQLVREVGFNACTPRQVARYGGCLIPKRCETLDAYERSGQIATFWRDTGYLRRTEQCRPFIG